MRGSGTLAAGERPLTAAPVCRFGLCARAVVSLVIGGFLIAAAARYDPSQARGVVGALTALRDQPYGQLVFATVAIGLLAFGVFGLVEAVSGGSGGAMMARVGCRPPIASLEGVPGG